jgi:hypothetical protein
MIKDNIWIYPTVITINDTWIWFTTTTKLIMNEKVGHLSTSYLIIMPSRHVIWINTFEAGYMNIMFLRQVIWLLWLWGKLYEYDAFEAG